MNLRTLFKNYMPLEIVHQKKDEIFSTLLDMLRKMNVDKASIVDQLFYFLSPDSKENLAMAFSWFKNSCIVLDESQICNLS